MQRSILFILCLLSLVACVSGYGLDVVCTDQVIAGTPVKCSIDSDFPAGTQFTLDFYSPSVQQVSSQQVTMMENKATKYKFFDTAGLPGGNYLIEARLKEGTFLRSGSRIQNTVIITNAQQVPTTTTATISPPAITVQVPVPATSSLPAAIQQITTSPTAAPTTLIASAPTKSVQDLLDEQNKKIDEQNRLIAEQNKKLESQNDLLAQFLSRFKSIFGWN